MGLFSTKKKTYVASSVYNLAGDEADRPDILKMIAVRSAVHGGLRASFADGLRSMLLNGTALSRRRFFAWAKRQYPVTISTAEMETP